MHIETLKYYIQSANINFLYGSGLSRPFLSTLGNIEKWLTELNERRQGDADQVKYAIVTDQDQGDRNFHTSFKHTIDTIYSLENRYLCVA